jgi:hypothetical protein
VGNGRPAHFVGAAHMTGTNPTVSPVAGGLKAG